MIAARPAPALNALETNHGLSIKCPPPCEATFTADTEDELVTKAQEHAQTVHREKITREDILKLAT